MLIEHDIISDNAEITVIKFFMTVGILPEYNNASVEKAFNLKIMEFVEDRVHCVYSSGQDYHDECISKVVIIAKTPGFSLS